MYLKSDNFQEDMLLDKKYSCIGEGISPELHWGDFPNGTKSFAFILEDPDAPSGNFIHWLVVNIPVEQNNIIEGANLFNNATELLNSANKKGYIPPCPPNGTHRYCFKVFALNIENLNDINTSNFYDKINPFIIDESSIMVKFSK